MGLIQRIWQKDNSSESKMYPDSVYMYDAGNFVGILSQKGKSKQKQWSGYSVISRDKTQETIEETLEVADDFSVPKTFYSIEEYPARIEATELWIPGWKIQWKQLPAAEASGSQSSQTSSPHPPLRQHTHPGQHQPSLQPAHSHSSPSFQPPRKSLSGKPRLSQHSSQNKSNNASKPKALPSSNQVSRAMPKQLTQATSGEHPSQSSPNGHTSPLLHPHQTSQPSPYPQPLLAPGGLNPRPTSSFPNRSSSKRHLPSQQAQRPREEMSQRPTSSQQSSHE